MFVLRKLFLLAFFLLSVFIAQPAAADKVDDLIETLKTSEDAVVMEKSIEQLAALGMYSEKAVPVLIAVYNSEGPQVCDRFECIRENSEPTDTYHSDLCNSALFALMQIGKGPMTAEGINTLAAFLKDKDGSTYHDNVVAALKTLAEMEEKARPVLPQIRGYMNSEFTDLRAEALKAIMRIDSDPANVVKAITDQVSKAEACCSAWLDEIAIPYLHFRNKEDMTDSELGKIDSSLEVMLRQGEKNGQFVHETAYLNIYAGILVKYPERITAHTIKAMAATLARLPSNGNTAGIIEIINLSSALKSRAAPVLPSLAKKIVDSSFSQKGYRAAAFKAVDAIDPAKRAEIVQACRKYMSERECR